MVHLVPDEGVDDGPVLATATVAIRPDDTLETPHPNGCTPPNTASSSTPSATCA